MSKKIKSKVMSKAELDEIRIPAYEYIKFLDNCKMKKNNIISDWLDQHGNPEIENKVLQTMENQKIIESERVYVLVEWPNSQEYMECDWFATEAILALGSEDSTGPSAYFIPINRFKNTQDVKEV